MEIIASTKEGVLISATSKEVAEIISSVTGEYPKELKIGQKIPAIDYAASIRKVKKLNEDTNFTYLRTRVDEFNKHFENLSNAVQSAASIEQ